LIVDPLKIRWIWAGVRCATAPGAVSQAVAGRGELSGRIMCRARQVVVKVCGVATTKPQGQSRAPRPLTGQQ